ncbi:MAG: hypothetical protein M0P71_17615 [Melioribacteraceae bacterium]|jgi:hypothetical protein|nr:hypothetical protein [Melioribacteraceae bacterium]
MKEKPILFSTEMVKAILDGRKTMTRRIIKPQPIPEPKRIEYYGEEYGFICESNSKKTGIFTPNNYFCPYGQPGDKLWVRETWQTGVNLNEFCAKEIKRKANEAGYKNGIFCPLWYSADGKYRAWGDNDIRDFGTPGRKRSSRFMPRWASRIMLEITDIRVERLQDITEDDAAAEGMPHHWRKMNGENQAVEMFKTLWDSLNFKRGYGWDDNPWVWAISFKRLS